MISSNVLNLHYSDDENINNDDRQDSNQSLRLLSSISPTKKRASKLSPDKLNSISPNKRVPLEIKSNNHVLANAHNNKGIINSKSLDANAKRKLLRKNITVTKTGSFAAAKNTQNSNSKLKNLDNGLVRYKSLVLDEFSETRASNDDDHDDLESFWIKKKFKNKTFGMEEEKDEGLDMEGKSVQKLINSNGKITLFDDLEYVPNKPAESDVFLEEPHTMFTKDDKRKLNDFYAPFSELHVDNSKVMQEFMTANDKYKNMNANADDSDSANIKNPYKTEKVDFTVLDTFNNFNTDEDQLSHSSNNSENKITEEQFEDILKQSGYSIGSIDLEF